MRTPSAQLLLNVWEAGRALPASRRAVALLSAALPEIPVDDLLELSVGRRDALILELHGLLFGPLLSATAACPQCREDLQTDFRVKDVLRRGSAEVPGELSVVVGDQQCILRLPRGDDLDAIADIQDVSTAARKLLERCLIKASCRGQAIGHADLCDEMIAVVGRKMADADPEADIQLVLRCPSCGHQWSSPFDSPAFLWSELDGWARRVLREVHVLARQYGWREADILQMSALRRQLYMDMVDG